MRMLVAFTSVKMAIDGGVRIFPDLEEGVRIVLILRQRRVVLV